MMIKKPIIINTLFFILILSNYHGFAVFFMAGVLEGPKKTIVRYAGDHHAETNLLNIKNSMLGKKTIDQQNDIISEIENISELYVIIEGRIREIEDKEGLIENISTTFSEKNKEKLKAKLESIGQSSKSSIGLAALYTELINQNNVHVYNVDDRYFREIQEDATLSDYLGHLGEMEKSFLKLNSKLFTKEFLEINIQLKKKLYDTFEAKEKSTNLKKIYVTTLQREKAIKLLHKYTSFLLEAKILSHIADIMEKNNQNILLLFGAAHLYRILPYLEKAGFKKTITLGPQEIFEWKNYKEKPISIKELFAKEKNENELLFQDLENVEEKQECGGFKEKFL